MAQDWAGTCDSLGEPLDTMKSPALSPVTGIETSLKPLGEVGYQASPAVLLLPLLAQPRPILLHPKHMASKQ